MKRLHSAFTVRRCPGAHGISYKEQRNPDERFHPLPFVVFNVVRGTGDILLVWLTSLGRPVVKHARQADQVGSYHSSSQTWCVKKITMPVFYQTIANVAKQYNISEVTS